MKAIAHATKALDKLGTGKFSLQGLYETTVSIGWRKELHDATRWRKGAVFFQGIRCIDNELVGEIVTSEGL